MDFGKLFSFVLGFPLPLSGTIEALELAHSIAGPAHSRAAAFGAIDGARPAHSALTA